MPKRRRKKRSYHPPELSIALILEWADRFHDRVGRWPNLDDKGLHLPPGETWNVINNCLRKGCRFLPGNSSLAQILAQYRGVRNRACLPRLTEKQILAWADTYHARTQKWPTKCSGPIAGTDGENWSALDNALKTGLRGLPGSQSLARLLEEQRGHRNRSHLQKLSIWRVVQWAKIHYQRTGLWPTAKTGPIRDAAGETWLGVASALREGLRGLPGGLSLAQLLEEQLGRRNRAHLSKLSVRQVVEWAKAHYRITGFWPTRKSGPIVDAPGETWACVNDALRLGLRGLPGGQSLPCLLEEQLGYRNRSHLPKLSISQIVQWAKTHYRNTGSWPISRSGPVVDVPGETWISVNWALSEGRRGLPGGQSLSKILQKIKQRVATSAQTEGNRKPKRKPS